MKRFKEIFLKFYHWIIHPYRIYRLGNFLVSRRVPYPRKSSGQEPLGIKAEKPIILFSSCENSLRTGDLKYSGGLKVYNLWAKLLRKHGYEAYIVTYDGNYRPWLIEHQPHISLGKTKQWKEEGRFLKFVTGWLDSKAFIDLAEQFYFIDLEIAYTITIHSALLSHFLKSKKIRKISTNSRTQQAWYMANFGLTPVLIQDWSDEDYWFSRPEKRQKGLVGYMKESFHSDLDIKEIVGICQKAGVNLKFIEIKGSEQEVINTMQECDFYLGFNPGKHPLWGEGCPRSQQEAMHTGCIVAAYDVKGNREYLIDSYTGFLVPSKRPDLLAEHLINLSQKPESKEKIRSNSIIFVSQVFTSSYKLPLLRKFLELEKNKIN